jgi:hypothetical protein
LIVSAKLAVSTADLQPAFADKLNCQIAATILAARASVPEDTG